MPNAESLLSGHGLDWGEGVGSGPGLYSQLVSMRYRYERVDMEIIVGSHIIVKIKGIDSLVRLAIWGSFQINPSRWFFSLFTRGKTVDPEKYSV